MSNFEDYYVDEELYGNRRASRSEDFSDRSSLDDSNSNAHNIGRLALAGSITIEVLDSNMKRQGSLDSVPVDLKIDNRSRDTHPNPNNNNPLYNTLL